MDGRMIYNNAADAEGSAGLPSDSVRSVGLIRFVCTTSTSLFVKDCFG